MESYYTDERVLTALKKSNELMDILTFIKEVDFKIKDNFGFDVLWDSLNGKQYTHVGIKLFKWMGYGGNSKKKKENFIKLLISHNIEYQELSFDNPLLLEFPDIQDEIDNMLPMHRARKKWVIMEPKNFKKAIMKLNTKRSDAIQNYYLLLEELIQLYDAYIHKFYISSQRPKTTGSSPRPIARGRCNTE